MNILGSNTNQRWSNRTSVRVLFEYSYSSTKESNRTRTRVHYHSNRTHDYFSLLHFVHMNTNVMLLMIAISAAMIFIQCLFLFADHHTTVVD